jgi:hypothetical protein
MITVLVDARRKILRERSAEHRILPRRCGRVVGGGVGHFLVLPCGTGTRGDRRAMIGR